MGKCYFCGRQVNDVYFCHGCNQHVCHECDKNSQVGDHEINDHKRVREINELEQNKKEEVWELKISRVQNGYILDFPTELPIVIEDDDNDELKSHEKLLWEIMEYFNFGGSKHDAERLRVMREKRDE